MSRWLLLGLALVTLAGCATLPAGEPRTIRKGGLGDGLYLLTVAVVPRGQVPEACQADRALACVRSWPVAVESGEVVRVVHAIVVYRPDLPWAAYELAAHETCHAVARVQDLDRDPCHDEDGGVLQSVSAKPAASADELECLENGLHWDASASRCRVWALGEGFDGRR